MDERTPPQTEGAEGALPPNGAPAPPVPFRSQRGAALIALVLALALGSGLVTVGWLEAAARSTHKALRTEAALAAARDALIGYAATYPDQHYGRHGPGYLPCPDTTGNGSPNSPCSANPIGRLPWRRLGLHDPRDGDGERLWYALARRFRANGYKHRPLNWETAAELVADGRSDIAAVVLAPGGPLAFQDRGRDRLDPARFLESGNEDPSDATYVSGDAPQALATPARDRLNDRVATISRDRLMAAAARRVLAETRIVLEQYRDAPWNSGAYPWLAPWDAPGDEALSEPGVTAGRLPVVRTGGSFETGFRVTGSLSGHLVSASGTVDTAGVSPLAGAFPVPAGRCVWTVATRADCTGESREASQPGRMRLYRFDLHLEGEVAVAPPSAAEVRRRSIRGLEWVEPSRVEILDLDGGRETGRGTLELGPGPTRGTPVVEGVAYPLGVGAEVPEWLVENEWHLALMVAVAPAFAGGGAARCGSRGRCLEVVRTSIDGRTDMTGAHAVVLVAGPALSHQRREIRDPVEWFEGENANPANLRYETRASGASFNDQATVIARFPGGVTP